MRKAWFKDSMKTVYDNGKKGTFAFESFEQVRERLQTQWDQFRPHMTALDATIIVKQDSIARGIKNNQSLNVKSISQVEPYNHYRIESNASTAPQSLTANLHKLDDLLSRLT